MFVTGWPAMVAISGRNSRWSGIYAARHGGANALRTERHFGKLVVNGFPLCARVICESYKIVRGDSKLRRNLKMNKVFFAAIAAAVCAASADTVYTWTGQVKAADNYYHFN